MGISRLATAAPTCFMTSPFAPWEQAENAWGRIPMTLWQLGCKDIFG